MVHTPHALQRLVSTVTRWQKRARERAELAQLDSRARRDLGLTDVDIWLEASKSPWRA